MMMGYTTRYEIKKVLFFFYGVVLATLTVWCVMQGVVLHFVGNHVNAGIYYFLGMFSLGALIHTYVQAKKHSGGA
jgi:hypothetical protein